MRILGVDPGASGGIAMLHEGFEPLAWKMPETEKDLIDLFRSIVSGHTVIAYMEAVHAFPGSGPVCPACKRPRAQGTTSTFAFGKNYGFLRGVLVTLGIPLIDVSPMKWKKALGLNFTAQDTKTDKKNGSKQLAQQWWPGIKITHAISEALLIAAYGRQVSK